MPGAKGDHPGMEKEGNMRKKNGLIVWLALLMTLFVAGTAAALSVSVSSNPPALTEGGSVDVSLRIQNKSGERAQNITLVTNTGEEQSLGEVEAGEGIVATLSGYSVEDSQLDSSVLWTLQWSEGDEWYSEDFSVKIPKSAGEAKLRVRTNVAKKRVLKGDSVDITYTVENAGDVPVSDIRVTDTITDDTIARGISLQPGETHKASYKAVIDEAKTSKARAKGVGPNGDEVTSYSGEEKIEIASAGLNIFLSQLEKTADDTGIAVQVVNDGDVALEKITLTDDTGQVIAEDISLEPEQEEQFDFDVPSTEARNVIVTAQYSVKDEEETLTASSEPLELKALYTPEEIKLDAAVRVDQTELDVPGKVAVEMTLTNNTPIELHNVVIREVLAGTLKTIPVLAQGTNTEELTLDVVQSRDLNFNITFEDSDGRPYEATVKGITITVKAVEPITSPEALPEKDTSNMGLLVCLALLLIALLAVLVAIVVLFIKRAVASRQAMEEEDVQGMLRPMDDKKQRKEQERAQRTAMRAARQEQKQAEKTGGERQNRPQGQATRPVNAAKEEPKAPSVRPAAPSARPSEEQRARAAAMERQRAAKANTEREKNRNSNGNAATRPVSPVVPLAPPKQPSALPAQSRPEPPRPAENPRSAPRATQPPRSKPTAAPPKRGNAIRNPKTLRSTAPSASNRNNQLAEDGLPKVPNYTIGENERTPAAPRPATPRTRSEKRTMENERNTTRNTPAVRPAIPPQRPTPPREEPRAPMNRSGNIAPLEPPKRGTPPQSARPTPAHAVPPVQPVQKESVPEEKMTRPQPVAPPPPTPAPSVRPTESRPVQDSDFSLFEDEFLDE